MISALFKSARQHLPFSERYWCHLNKRRGEGVYPISQKSQRKASGQLRCVCCLGTFIKERVFVCMCVLPQEVLTQRKWWFLVVNATELICSRSEIQLGSILRPAYGLLCHTNTRRMPPGSFTEPPNPNNSQQNHAVQLTKPLNDPSKSCCTTNSALQQHLKTFVYN